MAKFCRMSPPDATLYLFDAVTLKEACQEALSGTPELAADHADCLSAMMTKVSAQFEGTMALCRYLNAMPTPPIPPGAVTSSTPTALKLCRLAPSLVQGFVFNPTLLQQGLDLLLNGLELIPGPAAAVSAMLQKVVDQPGAITTLCIWLNSLTNPTAAAPQIQPATH